MTFIILSLDSLELNQLKVSIFPVEVPGLLVNHIKHINESIIDHRTSGTELNANRL